MRALLRHEGCRIYAPGIRALRKDKRSLTIGRPQDVGKTLPQIHWTLLAHARRVRVNLRR